MSNVKRTLSALLAIVMVFTTMTVAFTVIGSAAPTVPRNAAAVLNPNVSITVPQYLETYGTDYYQRGSNVKSGESVFVQITAPNGAEVKDVALACSDAGISLGQRIKQGQDGYSWAINGGTLKTAPSADGSSVVKWTFTYQVNGTAYTAEAWSSLKLLYNDPGFAVHLQHNNIAAEHKTQNYHVEWVSPLYGDAATETAEYFSQCYINEGSGKDFASTAREASSYLWEHDYGSGGSKEDTSPIYAKGQIYVDVGQNSDLSGAGMQIVGRPHGNYDNDGNHYQYYRGTTIESQTVNGASSNNFAVTQTGKTELSGEQMIADTFSGTLPAAGGSAVLNTQTFWEGNVKDHWYSATSHHYSYTKYTLRIATYDKNALKTALDTATAANYQASQFLNAAPSGSGYSAFRTWDQYHAALQQAWYIYGREDVSNAQVVAATDALNAALPKYNSGTGAWQSGMMYGPADYSRIDSIKATIPDVLDPDFYAAYSDGTYGKYYQYSYASALIDALNDIDYDRPLDARYQGVVDQMRANLAAAITNVEGKTKMVSVEFVANQTDVRNLPSAASTTLTGTVQKPATDPSKSYYRFTGWYFDEACTVPVTSWPLGINYTSPYFKADLNNKNDNAGVAYSLYAGWQLTGKTLSFDTQGGSTIATVTGENGAAYGGPSEVPTKPGWKFVGGYLDATTQNPVDWSTFTFGSVSIVYAKWEKDTFVVTFNAMGGAFANGDSMYTFTGLYGDPVTEPTPPTRSGNGFVGWFYDSATTQPVDFNSFTVPSSNMTIYAKWNASIRNVTLQANNGTAPVVMTYSIGAQVTAPATPSKAGFTFKQWCYNAALTQVVTFPFNMGADNLTLYAQYTPLKFNVYFSAGEGQMADSFVASDYYELDCGSVLVAPEEPTRPGYVFTGWTWEGAPYELTVVPAQNITLVASWEVEPNMVKFKLRTDAPAAISQGDVITATVSMQANHIVSTHAFVVYYDSRYFTPAINGQAVSSSIIGAAACSKTPGSAYFTIVQNAGGNVTDCGNANGRVKAGIAPTSQYFPADWAIDNYTLKDEYSQYEFVYFTVTDSRNGTRMQPAEEQDIASFQFIVRDDAPTADGTSTYAQILMPSEFTRTPDRTNGKIYAAPEVSTEYVAKKNYDNTTNVVLNGDQRFAVVQMQSCRINFVTNNGSAVDAMDAKRGRTITLPTTTRPNYNFLGWTLTNSASDTAYVNASAYLVPEAETVTLYAKWGGQQTNYYVRHHKQNLTATGWLDNYEQETLQAAFGSTVMATPKTYEGFTCSNASEQVTIQGDNSNPTIIDLYYVRKTVRITLNANGGAFSNNQQTVTLSGLYEADVVNPYSNPTRTGYSFGGWEHNNAAYTIGQYPASDLVLLAKWTPNSVTVRFFLNGSSTPSWTKSGKYGDPITAPTVEVSDGQVFTGWKNSSGVPFTYTTFPAASEDFYGEVVIDGYTLTLYVDGVQYGDPIGVRNGTQVTESMLAYTPQPGYTFTGWRTANSVDAALAVFPMTLRANSTLYGFTTRQSYSIRTYIFVDGELEDGPMINNLFYGQAFDLPEADDYTDAGFGFRGWYTDEALTKPYTKPATMPAQNIVLYGEYYELVGTIEFNLNGGTGTAPASITEAFNTEVTLPGGNGFSKPLYKFGGWALSPTSTTAITSYMIDSAGTVTLYAIWTVNYQTISFDLNGADSGTRPESRQVEVGTTIPAADLPAGTDFVREGFIFAGWGDKKASTTPLDAYAVAATGSKTLYAVWAPAVVELIAREGSTTVIDNERGFIYGLDFGVDENALRNAYLDVIGNGTLEFEYDGAIGTGAVVKLRNNYSNEIDATYTIVIFGDVNGDGMLTTTDITAIRNINARISEFTADSANYFAADVTHDGMVNPTDVTEVRSVNARLSQKTIDQVGTDEG
ncbi:MAG: InlB B-repeat-containing protein [Clostridia bacterium]|nr:InlB B-repeat-containing protein [Clostridia bacterium]